MSASVRSALPNRGEPDCRPDEPDCPLCRPTAAGVLYSDAELRIVQVGDPQWPGFCRVIWKAHVKEMTDLPTAARQRLMRAVWATEAALRELLRPAKINLASLGNQVPHLHWHVIPRFTDDPCFPDAIWAPARRAGGAAQPCDDQTLAEAILKHFQPTRRQ